jgi:uncharacterized protein YegL
MNQRHSLISGGLRRPNWVNRLCHQKAVFVRDRSGSMSGQKATDASAASGELVNELAQPSNKDGFWVAVVDFDDTADVIHSLEKATRLAGRVQPIAPRGGTNITAGLEEAYQILRAAEANPPQGVSFLRPVVLIYSDGGHNTGPHPRAVADQIKQIADLVTIGFGGDADEALLRELATSPQHFYRCRNGKELRCFLAAVGATISGTLSAGVNATNALSQIKQQPGQPGQ